MDLASDKKSDAATNLDSAEYEAKIKQAHKQNKRVVQLRRNLNTHFLQVPRLKKHPPRLIEFTDAVNPVKKSYTGGNNSKVVYNG